ncbi:MAG: ATP-dependent helicase HrpB [Planctomycetes bacterium]|nr:ATP-dependent helicase HrpB [Planctomycetota bacterium]
MPPVPLPVDDLLPRLRERLAAGTSLVLTAPTGSGKTTRVPPALLDAGFGKVLVLEPRRVAARAAAARMADERGGRLGDEVGYSVRFDRRTSRATRLEVLTVGLFVRRLLDDPFLEGVGAVVFDEFHERSLDVDLAFAMVRRVREQTRADLRVVVMSATLDAAPIAAALGDAPVLAGEGRLFPVDVQYLPAPLDLRLPELVRTGVRAVLAQTPGDVLVFLPGLGEIRACAEALAELARGDEVDVVALHGELPLGEQDRALRKGPRRRVVLSTNVAESSVTVEGVTAVVDGGKARVLRHDPALGLNRLELVSISRQSAEQRAGRAGRLAPGVCARLWTRAEQRSLQDAPAPEVCRLDLCAATLQLLDWGERDPRDLPWLEPPPDAAVERALQLLGELGALRDGTITAAGRALAKLPVHPRVGRLLLEGRARGVEREACLAAALLEERDPFGRAPRDGVASRSASDVLDRVAALEAFAAGRRAEGHAGRRLDAGAARRVLAVADALGAALAEGDAASADAPHTTRDVPSSAARDDDGLGRLSSRDEALLRALLAAFPDRLARRRAPGDERVLLVGGRGARLSGSAVRDAELLVCVDLDAGGGADARVSLASGVRRAWLDPDGLDESVELAFDPEREAVGARRRVRWRGLLLDEGPAPLPDAHAVAAVLAEAAAGDPARALPSDEGDVATLLARLRCLSAWMPELGLPRLDREGLLELLPGLCVGRRSFAELRKAPWRDAILARLDHRQRQALAIQAPERLAVPSGSQITLHYEEGRPPVLAVRIQELFGLAETPRVAGGRVPVLLHLLAPNMRPQQITDDLAGFWERTYPLVRRELRARYPKHAWPDDPIAARAERRPRRKG